MKNKSNVRMRIDFDNIKIGEIESCSLKEIDEYYKNIKKKIK